MGIDRQQIDLHRFGTMDKSVVQSSAQAGNNGRHRVDRGVLLRIGVRDRRPFDVVLTRRVGREQLYFLRSFMSPKSGLVAMQMEVDAAADLFERDWKLQGSPEIKDHLVGVAPPLRQILLEELIYIDSEYRRRSGHVVHFDEYRSRFPELASDEEWVKLLQAAIDRVEEQGSKPQDTAATRTIELGSGRPQPSLPRQTPQNDAKADKRASTATSLCRNCPAEVSQRCFGSLTLTWPAN